MRLFEKIHLAYRSLGAAGKSVLLSVSGGGDSSALMWASASLSMVLDIRLEVACFDHGLRVVSAQEVKSVKKCAASLKLPFHERQLNLGTSQGLEQRARTARYRALESIRQIRGLDLIATGHTQDDQAETLLMRLVRGTSLTGARCIHARRGRVIRPLLKCSKQELRTYLVGEGRAHHEDQSNQDLKYFRNRIRHIAMPALERSARRGTEAVSSSVQMHLAHFADWAQEDDLYLANIAEQQLDRLTVRPGPGLDVVGLLSLSVPIRRRVFALMLTANGVPVSAGSLARCQEALEKGQTSSISRNIRLNASSGVLRFVREETRSVYTPSCDVPSNGSINFEGLSCQLVHRAVEVSLSDWHLEIAEEQMPLSVRFRKPGDRLAEGGKLQDLFVNLRILEEDRARWPVVADRSDQIVGVVGLKISNAASKSEVRRWFLNVHYENDGQAVKVFKRYNLL